MQKQVLTVIVVVVALAAIGYYFWPMMAKAPVDNPSGDMGTYVYNCDNGVQFTMSPASDMSSIALEATSAQAPFGAVTLPKVANGSYATEDGEFSFMGKGETVTIGLGAQTMVCTPMPSAEAPFNWGDVNY